MAFADHPRQELLLPVKGSFIAFSLMLGLMFNMIPLTGIALALKPDFVILVVLYWCINQPQRVGISIAFGMGLLMDLGNANTFGQHALVYSVMAFIALTYHRRLNNFAPLQQAPQIGLILLLGQSITFLLGVLNGSPFPGLGFYLASFSGILLWPLLVLLLKIPQKPRSDPNAL